MTRYGFRSAIGAFFHGSLDTLSARLPAGLRALESYPGLGVFALTVFDFDASEVGAYREFVASILVPPYARRGQELPHASFFPIVLATTSEASRAHAQERWRLPKLERCAQIDLKLHAEGAHAGLSIEGQRVLSLEVGAEAQAPSRRLYQCFSADLEGVHRVDIAIEGALSEHEDERGELELSEHPLARSLAPLVEDLIPFREQVMSAGEQRFTTLTLHSPRRETA